MSIETIAILVVLVVAICIYRMGKRIKNKRIAANIPGKSSEKANQDHIAAITAAVTEYRKKK